MIETFVAEIMNKSNSKTITIPPTVSKLHGLDVGMFVRVSIEIIDAPKKKEE